MKIVGMKALTIGSATIDVITTVDNKDIERMTMHNATSSFLLLEEGCKVDVASVNCSVGGGATNTAVALTRLGYDSACLIRLGKDLEGDEILETLRAENIDTRLVIRNPELPTGKTIMVSSHVRNPTVFTSRGANSTLEENEIGKDLFVGRDLVYVAGLSGTSASCLKKIVRCAKEAGAFVAVNPGMQQIKYWAGDLLEAMDHIDLLSVNALEAAQLALSGIQKREIAKESRNKQEALEFLKRDFNGRDIEMIMERLLYKGPRIFLVTNGPEGAYAGTKHGVDFYPAQKVKIGSTAGAGDAFASTFAAYAAAGENMESCLKLATCNAAAVIQVSDTHSGLLRYSEINHRIAN